MKKQTKGKRTPPRRKPLRKSQIQRITLGHFHVPQAMRDEMEAERRAMLESMPSAVSEEYLRLRQMNVDDMSAVDDARIEELLDEYDRPQPSEVVDRHLADIVREREQAASQLPQQDGTAP